ncbi:MAG TPA: histidine kinase dimerization/phospho-acceptor domain-containing protein [Thermoanaerobaculia bacterium]|nr:histidine kinase dimerization/phospho-acceptor domain-containing protein [Thermoanaerobaculia bacterium]
MTELLLHGELTPLQREQVGVIRTSVEALLALVNDILDLSRIEAGRFLLRPQDFSFRELAQDVFRLLAPQAAEREVELRLHLDPALPDIRRRPSSSPPSSNRGSSTWPPCSAPSSRGTGRRWPRRRMGSPAARPSSGRWIWPGAPARSRGWRARET